MRWLGASVHLFHVSLVAILLDWVFEGVGGGQSGAVQWWETWKYILLDKQTIQLSKYMGHYIWTWSLFTTAVATKLNLLLHLQLLLKTTATYGCLEFPLWGSSHQWLFHKDEASCWGFFFSSSVANGDQVLTADVIVESNLRSDLLTSYMSRQRELSINPLNLLHASMWLKSRQEAWSRKLGTVTGRFFCFFKPMQRGSSRSRSSIRARRAISCMSPPCSEPPQAVACS